eukprot:TRINITY_DN6296_c0_g1_i1.p1 TRINITY_DN6296_c0_g1~~TRINITY_DN6296_c0_g1_i1.p1  ORF type:complete len:282 (+),score=57.69 TRINITY_DN6296_c0_g1_i1:43-846(+)
MGCVLSQDASSNQNPKASSSGGAANKEEIPDFEERWRDDIMEIWGRAISKLPVHTDVPRLCKKITITNDAGDKVYDGSSKVFKKATSGAIAKALLLSLAKSIGDSDMRTALEDWEEFVPDSSGDMGEHVQSFFQMVTDAHEETTSMLVLKLVHQRIIFPAFYCLKDIIQPSVGRFKDKRGCWTVEILINPDQSVQVIHHKRQQSVDLDANNEPLFEFDWSLCISVDLEQGSILPTIEIRLSNLYLSSSLDSKRSTAISTAIDKKVIK